MLHEMEFFNENVELEEAPHNLTMWGFDNKIRFYNLSIAIQILNHTKVQRYKHTTLTS